MQRADYTLAQAVAMVNLLAEQWHDHFCGRCQECVDAYIEGDDFKGEDHGYCERGVQILRLKAKWKRRCKYAPRREGTTITV